MIFRTSRYDPKNYNVVIDHFPDDEVYIRFLDKLSTGNVRLYHRMYPHPNRSLLELIFIASKLKGIDEVYVPYLPFARQDKTAREGEFPLIFEVLNLLSSVGVKKLITYDCHFLKGKREFKWKHLTLINHSAADLLIEHARTYFDSEFLVISPDFGASYMIPDKHFTISKSRGAYSKNDGLYRKIKSMDFDFDVQGKDVFVIDDLIAGGGTMYRAASLLKSRGASRVVCGAVHGLFIGNALDRLNEICDGVFVSDSIVTPISEVHLSF